MDEILRAPQEEFPLHTQRKGRAPSAQGGREKAERAGERFRKLMEAGAAQGRVFRLQGCAQCCQTPHGTQVIFAQ